MLSLPQKCSLIVSKWLWQLSCCLRCFSSHTPIIVHRINNTEITEFAAVSFEIAISCQLTAEVTQWRRVYPRQRQGSTNHIGLKKFNQYVLAVDKSGSVRGTQSCVMCGESATTNQSSLRSHGRQTIRTHIHFLLSCARTRKWMYSDRNQTNHIGCSVLTLDQELCSSDVCKMMFYIFKHLSQDVGGGGAMY